MPSRRADFSGRYYHSSDMAEEPAASARWGAVLGARCSISAVLALSDQQGSESSQMLDA